MLLTGDRRALVALIHMYGISGQPLEPVFDLLYSHLDTEKLPMKETLLISVGLMGKCVIIKVTLFRL